MSVPGSANSLLLASAAGGYQISRSLRFNSSDSAYLSRTPASAGNRKKWTFSFWLKRQVSAYQQIFTVDGTTEANYFQFAIENNDKLAVRIANNTNVLVSTQVFRDPSAWYHIVLTVDTAQATSANRARVYVNGAEITAFDTASYPTQNADLNVNTTNSHLIGRAKYNGFSALHSDCYMADIHFIDGQALTPSSFAETNATTGQWVPKAYTGTYGTNGFHLDFSDNSAATAATLGADSSGNGNNWTPNNLSVTAGAGNDSLIDSPTNYGTDTGVGGEVRGNYCTLNPLSTVTTVPLSNGNLEYTTATTGQNAIGTIGVISGSWYWEAVASAGTTQTRAGVYGTSASSLYSFATNNNVYGFRFNADTGALDYTTNGSTFTSLATGLTSGPYFPYFNNNGTTSKTVRINFGQRPFAYTAPSGFKALCTANMPAPVITKGSEYMDVALYTGNGSTQTISGLEFSPDLVWIKLRSTGTYAHALTDTVRGAGLRLSSNTTNVEDSYNAVISFDSSGFTLGNVIQNSSGLTGVAWCWDAGSSTVTNTAGSITSQVRANPSVGFSIVTYTGTGANATVGHGLGVSPSIYLIKRRDVSDNFLVFTTIIDGSLDFLLLNTTAVKGDASVNMPTSSLFSLGSAASSNANGGTYVAYCFAPVNSYSAFGSYTGNGSTDGSFVFCNFRPRWILLKRTDTTSNWTIIDTAREGYNVDNDPLFPNLSDAEGTTDLADILSNGFKLRSTDASVNASAGTYIYAAFAESPFSLARAR